MIDPKTFTAEHIQSIQRNSKRDPALIERSIFALGLLEAIARSELPFIFKGGTSLMLLMDRPCRFSTDIDIVVTPDVEIDKFLEIAATIWPFIKLTEQTRNAIQNIEKRHFKFAFTSPLHEKELTILLDVLFEENQYSTTVERSVDSDLLQVMQPTISVRLPNANCILADKLTAFAPNTSGIPYGVDKELEIIKQLYDIAALVEYIDDFTEVKTNYRNIVKTELKYRKIDATPEDALNDTIRTAVCVAGRGLYYPKEYNLLKRGIANIRNHIYSEVFNGEVAVRKACMVMFLAAAILTDQNKLDVFRDDAYYNLKDINLGLYNRLVYLRKTDALAYKYLVEAVTMLSTYYSYGDKKSISG